MSVPFAKLEACGGSDTNYDFLLNRDLISIGRAPDNNLVLSEPGVSRHHAQILKEADGYVITDLGSSSGTYINNQELLPRTLHSLADGDVIQIGASQLRFRTFNTQAPETTSTNYPLPLQNTVIASQPKSAASTVVLAAPNIPILRVSTPKWTQDFPLERNNLVIGRAFESDIAIDAPVISVRHAEIRKCEAGYEIVDLNSRNGLVYDGRQITQKILADGDVFYIGSVVMLMYQAVPATEASAPIKRLELGGRTNFSLGRDSENDTVIDHPAVSRFHARIQRQEGSLVITDLNTTNGTFVNGKQIERERVLKTGDVVRIGPYRLVFNIDETLVCQNEEGNLRLDALHLNKVAGKGTTVLHDISLSILAREFVAVVGVSGAGKSTLLDALNGFRPATSGVVLVNDIDLYKNFNAYRTELGYVPQDDIIHRELTVAQALDYAAQLRMPADTTAAERRQRIQEVLADLELTQRQGLPIRNLSGGQRKRVSMGVELLTKPSLFFLDEATSGLDPGTESQMMKLLRRLADQGRTILLITHATKNVMMCDLVVFLAKGGRIAYFGPPEAALTYFGVSDFDEIYSKVESELSPEEWQSRYRQSPQYQQYVVNRQRSFEQLDSEDLRLRPQQQQPGSGLKRISAWQQFLILSQRNLATLFRDRASLVLMLALAPILGLLDFVTWQRNLFDIRDGNAGQALTMLFVTALIAVMVGSLATMREIVKEVEIYRRERMIGLQIAPYILSKVWIGVLLALYQAAVFLLAKKLAVDIPGGSQVLLSMYVTLVLTTIVGMVMGLLVSALSPNQNMAPLLTILFLVPQITFGGGMLPVKTFGLPGQIINQVSITKWSFEALVTTTGLGQDVAKDPCWQLQEADRKQLTEVQRNKCDCLGANLFTRCTFPGIQARYDPAVDEPQPQQPKDPGEPPQKPELPKSQSFKAQQNYQQATKEYQNNLEAYQERIKKYRQATTSWQENYTKWKEKYASAINSAEGILDRFYGDYGGTFDVKVTRHWGMLGLEMVVMFGALIWVQKRKDIL